MSKELLQSWSTNMPGDVDLDIEEAWCLVKGMEQGFGHRAGWRWMLCILDEEGEGKFSEKNSQMYISWISLHSKN